MSSRTRVRRSGRRPARRAKRRRRQAVPKNLKNAIIKARETGYVDRWIEPYSAAVGTVGSLEFKTTTGDVQFLNLIPQNTTVNGRVGKAVMMKGLTIRALINTGATLPASAMVLLVYDKRPDGGAVDAAAVLDATIHAGLVNLQQNLDAVRSRFRVLRRWDLRFVSNALASAGSATQHLFHEYVDLKGLRALYKDASGTYDQLEEGGLWLICGGDTATGNCPTIAGSCRLRYYDV